MSARDFSPRAAGRRPVWIAVAGPLLALLAVVLAVRQTSAVTSRARVALTEVRADVDELQRRLDARRADGSQRQARSTWSREAPPARILAEIEALMPAEVRLAGVRLDYGSAVRVDMEVVTQGPEAWDAFVQRLGSSPRFASVLPGEESRQGAIRARVSAVWRTAP